VLDVLGSKISVVGKDYIPSNCISLRETVDFVFPNVVVIIVEFRKCQLVS